MLVLIAVSLAGCMIGPDYHRPAVDIPHSYRYADGEGEKTANSVWWKQFRDPVLDELIGEALAQNKDIKIAAANIEQAAGVLSQVRAPLFPQVSYGGGGARNRLSEKSALQGVSGVANPRDTFQLFAGATWEIDLWGRIRRLSEAARASMLASVEARRGVILTLVSSVASSYFQLRGLDEQLAISRSNLAAYAESVKLFELQYKHGQVSRMNVEQARTQYETAAATIPQLESQIVELENALSLLLGRNPGPIVRGKSIDDLAMPRVPAGIPSQILENRPDIRQAEQNLIAANAQIGAARAQYFPTISLTGDYGWESSKLSGLFKGAAHTWSFAGSFAGPIFTAGAISGQVRQAEAGREAGLLAYQSSIQSAFADVENALSARRKLIEQLASQERLVKASREYEHLAWLQYNGGYTPYSTVLQAQQQLFPAELNRTQTRVSVFISLVNIYKAMGGGWINEADKLTDLQPAKK